MCAPEGARTPGPNIEFTTVYLCGFCELQRPPKAQVVLLVPLLLLLLLLLLVPSVLPVAGNTEAVPVPGTVVPVPVAGTTTVAAVQVAGTTATLLLALVLLKSSPRTLTQ